MPEDDRDLSFINAAIEAGALQQDRAVEALRLQSQAREQGRDARIWSVLLEQGWMEAARVRELLRKIGEPEDLIPGYEILGTLGTGGMGTVYKARQTRMGRLVALKVLRKHLVQEQEFVDRFLRETRLAARVSHPNLVTAYDAGEFDGTYYYAMEFVEGQSLRQIIDRGPLDEGTAFRILRQILRALAVLQKHGLIHRDIKPENILVTKQGVAKLCDLGLARPSKHTGQSLTQTGILMGTPHYVSPEQARGERDLDIRSDIYSLGATLYCMLTGRPPFEAASPEGVLVKHVTEPLPDPRKWRRDLSPRAHHILLRMLEKDRRARYRTPAEVLADLDSPQVPARPPTQRIPRKPPTQRHLKRPPTMRMTRRMVRETPLYRKSGFLIPAAAVGLGIVILLLANPGGSRPRPQPADPPKAPAPEAPDPRETRALNGIRSLVRNEKWRDALQAIENFRKTYGAASEKEIARLERRCREGIEAERLDRIAEMERAAREASSAEKWTEAIEKCNEILALPNLPDPVRTRVNALRRRAIDNLGYRIFESVRDYERRGEWAEAAARAAMLPDGWTGPSGSTREELIKRFKREQEAEALLEEARAQFGQKAWTKLPERVEKLLGSYAGTVTVGRAREEIEGWKKLLLSRQLRLEQVKRLLERADRAFEEKKWWAARDFYRRVLHEHADLPPVNERRPQLEKRIERCTAELAKRKELVASRQFAIAELHLKKTRPDWEEALRLYRSLLDEYADTEFVRRRLDSIRSRVAECQKRLGNE